MKNLYIFLLLLVAVGSFGQIIEQNDGLKNNVLFDHYGNKYNPSDIKIDKNVNNASRGVLLCSTAMFNLYFDPGSGMEIQGDAVHVARRAVVCQVFEDLTNFINSPLKNPLNTTKVNIWVRNINQVQGFQSPALTSNTLGLASSFYPINTTYANSGPIADGEIWKTINSGQDSYTSSFYLTQPVVLGPFNLEGGFYHGMMAFNFDNLTNNWNTNLGVNAPLNSVDLYTVVLHEVLHALGFASLIDFDGNSRLGTSFKAFGRYDRFLKDVNNNFLISNNVGCSMYDYSFNQSSNISVLHPGCTLTDGIFNGTSDHTVCGTAIQYSGRSTVPVYTPVCYERGSSLSHFEDELYPTCNPANNNANFIMSNLLGFANTKRFLKSEERNVLLDIGYSVNTTYGNANHNSFINYGSTFVNNNIVAGINDGLNSLDGTYNFFGNQNVDITINGILLNDFTNSNSTDFNTNDIQNLRFECLEELPNSNTISGILSTTSGDSNTSIIYRSNGPGIHLLKYVPFNVLTQQRGNVTYIYLYVFDNTNCANITPNNLVYNGDFEQYSSIPDNLTQINRACGWKQVNNATPDYYHAQTPIATVGIPCNYLGTQTVSNNIGNAYAGIFNVDKQYNFYSGGLSSWNETISTKLVTALLPNTKYQLCFDVSLADAASLYAMKFQAYFSKYEIPLFNFGNIPIADPNMLFTNSFFSTIADNGSDLTNGWQRVSFTFTTGSISGEQFLYIGGLKNVEYVLRTPATLLSDCYHMNYNVSGPNFDKATYYYLDNVSLIPFTGPTLNLPNQVCSSSIISNLSSYLAPSNSVGIFSGLGVVNNNGVYSFNAAIAGLGSHTITYLNNSGCGTLATDIVTVINNSLVPTFNQVNPVCSGSPIILESTSLNNITGTWSIINNNTTSVTYQFVPNSGECATTTTMTIGIIPIITPLFVSVSPVCMGAVIPALSTTSENGILGSWSPVLDNTVTTTYTFTPTSGQCATNGSITITVLPANDPACSNCQPNLTLSTPEGNATIVYKRQNWIETNSNYTTVVGQNIIMKAGDYINWKPNTRIVSGTVLHAKIENCIVTPIAPSSSKIVLDTEVLNQEVTNTKEIVNVYPNPTNGFVTITGLNVKIKSITIQSMEGKVIYGDAKDKGKTEYQLDMSNYQKGVYILSVETIEGEIIRKKLIKN